MARFHRFLAGHYEFPRIKFPLTGQVGSPELGVSANLVTQAEFATLIDLLKDGKSSPSRLRSAQIWISTLAFRCGLRPTEARSLALGSLQWGHRPELIIRLIRTKKRTHFKTKSTSGVRRLPIHALLTKSELAELYEWWLVRMREPLVNPDDFLFTRSPDCPEPYSAAEVITPIQEALRQLTGDQTIEFYHLRHSFATWLNVVLYDFTWHHIHPDSLPFGPGNLFTQENRSLLVKELLGNEGLRQKALYLTALLMGHAAPDMTLLHYTHLNDWLLGQYLRDPRRLPQLSIEHLCRLTGIPRSTVYWRNTRNSSEGPSLTELLASLRMELLPNHADPLASHVLDYPDLQWDDHGDPYDIMPALGIKTLMPVYWQCRRNPKKIKGLSEIWDIPEVTMCGWLARAQLIADLRTIGIRLRHEVWTNKTGEQRHKSRPKNRQSPFYEPFPPLPESDADDEIVSRMLTAYDSTSETVRMVIRTGVEFFLHHFNHSQHDVRFTLPTMALRYLQFLECLGIRKEEMHLYLYQPRPVKNVSYQDEEMKEWWLQRLGLPHINMTSYGRGNWGRSVTGSIGIKVVNTTIGQTPDPVITALYGFRYALYMIAILDDQVLLDRNGRDR